MEFVSNQEKFALYQRKVNEEYAKIIVKLDVLLNGYHCPGRTQLIILQDVLAILDKENGAIFHDTQNIPIGANRKNHCKKEAAEILKKFKNFIAFHNLSRLKAGNGHDVNKAKVVEIIYKYLSDKLPSPPIGLPSQEFTAALQKFVPNLPTGFSLDAPFFGAPTPTSPLPTTMILPSLYFNKKAHALFQKQLPLAYDMLFEMTPFPTQFL